MQGQQRACKETQGALGRPEGHRRGWAVWGGDQGLRHWAPEPLWAKTERCWGHKLWRPHPCTNKKRTDKNGEGMGQERHKRTYMVSWNWVNKISKPEARTLDNQQYWPTLPILLTASPFKLRVGTSLVARRLRLCSQCRGHPHATTKTWLSQINKYLKNQNNNNNNKKKTMVIFRK